MKTAQAAQQVGMTEAALRSVNNIPPNMVVKAGSTLLVPRTAQRHTDVSEQVADHAVMALAPDGPRSKRVALRADKKKVAASKPSAKPNAKPSAKAVKVAAAPSTTVKR
jgi:membrane-bound lytic murein transglycosylase D